MAFNFNWSPLIADTSRAREMLTSALNKSPKPPIIVDDIVVTELNLGQIPPELEILEIGDLAEDRFCGIFKMQYVGDAYLTLKTKVEANPLNTYLSTKPSFASPQPLAAATSLTIPLQITLSDIRLSGFVVLVFSRQKGITLVFRNDPLESLKVSSTFDSIPFVRDYLQAEIESQLRLLFMEDLPAIIHRLSLRLFVPEHEGVEAEAEINSNDLEPKKPARMTVDPFMSPSQAATARQLDDLESSPFSLSDDTQSYPSFSQRNLLRLAALEESQHTLSLFTPPIHDSVFRAWAGVAERGESQSPLLPGFTLSSLKKLHSRNNSSTSLHTFSDPGAPASSTTRPSLHASASTASVQTSTALSSSGKRHHRRKRKHHVVDLRKKQEAGHDTIEEVPSRPSTPTSSAGPSSSYGYTESASQEREGEISTPPCSPEHLLSKAKSAHRSREAGGHEAKDVLGGASEFQATDETPRASRMLRESAATKLASEGPATVRKAHASTNDLPSMANSSSSKPQPKLPMWVQKHLNPGATTSAISSQSATGEIMDQAWMTKIASEIADRVQAERQISRHQQQFPTENRVGSEKMAAGQDLRRSLGWDDDSGVEQSPPPAYDA